MWIRTESGSYVNTDRVFKFGISESKLGGYNIVARGETDFEIVARLKSKDVAQTLLDILSGKIGRVIDVIGGD